MKKMLFLNALAIILVSGIFPACQKDEIISNHESGLMLKSGSTDFGPECNSTSYQLITNRKIPVGIMDVSDDGTYLKVELVADENHSFSEVHLWVGANSAGVPVNRQEIPVPGRFTYGDGGSSNYEYFIKLRDIFSNTTGKTGGKDLYIYSHVVIDISNGNKRKEEITAWSEGMDFGSSRWGSYSIYTTCIKTGGEGCTPHTAIAGSTEVEGGIYYDNITRGPQNIYADNGEFVGKAEYDGEKIIFYFDQDWTFPDANPLVKIQAFNEPGDTPSEEITSIPVFPQGEPYVEVSSYPFYIIQLNVQYCTTE